MASRAPAMPEAALQAAVLQLCRVYGIRYFHPAFSWGSGPGWPDLVLCKRRVIYRELKRETGKPTPAQVEWGAWLQEAGQDWAVWRPADLHSGRIQRELEAIR